jgi:hypothetical protein
MVQKLGHERRKHLAVLQPGSRFLVKAVGSQTGASGESPTNQRSTPGGVARSVFLVRMKTVAIAASQGQSAIGAAITGEQPEQTGARRKPSRQERRNQQQARQHTCSHAAQDLRPKLRSRVSGNRDTERGPASAQRDVANGKKLTTLRDAALYITKLPKAEHDTEEWQAAMEALLLVAEDDGPTMFARIFALCPRIPYTVGDRFCVPIVLVALPRESQCHCKQGISLLPVWLGFFHRDHFLK